VEEYLTHDRYNRKLTAPPKEHPREEREEEVGLSSHHSSRHVHAIVTSFRVILTPFYVTLTPFSRRLG